MNLYNAPVQCTCTINLYNVAAQCTCTMYLYNVPVQCDLYNVPAPGVLKMHGFVEEGCCFDLSCQKF